MAHGQITHIEIPADDVERARRFYRELFAIDTNETEAMPGYFMFHFGPIASSGGAIGKRGKEMADNLRVYVEVDALDPVLARVAELGGKIKEGRTEVPGRGWFAVIDDSEGTELGLFEALPRQG